MKRLIISGIIGAIALSVIISVIALQMSSTDEEFDIKFEDNELENYEEDLITEFETVQDFESQIEEKYDETKVIKENVTILGSGPRDWPTSGPFKIDRSHYLLGETVFVQVDGLLPEEKGQIAFLRPLNETHYNIYTTIPFDGKEKNHFNQYFKISISNARGICSVNDLIGTWLVVFQGTNYENIKFEIINEILRGEEKLMEPVC